MPEWPAGPGTGGSCHASRCIRKEAFAADEDGVTLVEYGLITALVAIATMIACCR